MWSIIDKERETLGVLLLPGSSAKKIEGLIAEAKKRFWELPGLVGWLISEPNSFLP
jgi:hypothetical protein